MGVTEAVAPAGIPAEREGAATHAKHRAHVPALDGIRALAVLAVLAYHFEGQPLAGGFLGVSTFFTLSGFLMTTLIIGEWHRNGRVDIPRFWLRRCRRLLPAAFLGLALIVALSWCGLYLPGQVDDAREGLPWTLAYLANWHQLSEGGGYLAQLSAPSPLEHFWSLAIEEQFYVLFPVCVVVLLLIGRGRGRLVLAAAIAVAALASATLPLLRELVPDRVYLGTDTRMAELLLGALLALCLRGGLRGPSGGAMRRTAALAGPIVLAAVLASWILIEDSWSPLYHGGLPVYAILSAALVMSALVPGPLSTLLSVPVLVAIGRISYGLYVFHWPIYLAATPRTTHIDGLALATLRLLLTFMLALASYVWLERHVRAGAGPVAGAGRRILAPVAVAVACLALVVGSVTLPSSPAVVIAGADANGDVVPDAAPEVDEVLDRAAPWRVLVVTDERGAALVAPLQIEAARSGRWTVAGTARLDCVELQQAPTCPWERDWPDTLARTAPDAVVVLADVWDYRSELEASLPGTGARSEDGLTWASGRLIQGLDLLAPGDRPVLWVSWPVEAENGDRQELADASWSITRRVTAARPGLVWQDVTSAAPAALAAPIAVQASGARADAHKVMVVGDSVGASLAVGLEEWGRSRDVVVWNNARGGCGVARAGHRVGLDGSKTDESTCLPWRSEWAGAALRWKADTVVVLVGVWDVADRELPEASTISSPGDTPWDDYLVAEYVAAVDELAATGADVVLVTPPCMGYDGDRIQGGAGSGAPVFAEGRQGYLSAEILPRVVLARPTARIYDLNDSLCPGGRFTELVSGADLVRPDGVHFGPTGARWWAVGHADELVGDAQAAAP